MPPGSTADRVVPFSRRVLMAGAVALAVAANARADEVRKERAREPEPVFVDVGRTRYEAVHWGKAMGLGQNGGFIKASDIRSGRVLWLHRVYDVAYTDGRESDKQDVFITALALARDGRSITVHNDRRQSFIFDLRTLGSREVPAPANAR